MSTVPPKDNATTINATSGRRRQASPSRRAAEAAIARAAVVAVEAAAAQTPSSSGPEIAQTIPSTISTSTPIPRPGLITILPPNPTCCPIPTPTPSSSQQSAAQPSVLARFDHRLSDEPPSLPSSPNATPNTLPEYDRLPPTPPEYYDAERLRLGYLNRNGAWYPHAGHPWFPNENPPDDRNPLPITRQDGIGGGAPGQIGPGFSEPPFTGDESPAGTVNIAGPYDSSWDDLSGIYPPGTADANGGMTPSAASEYRGNVPPGTMIPYRPREPVYHTSSTSTEQLPIEQQTQPYRPPCLIPTWTIPILTPNPADYPPDRFEILPFPPDRMYSGYAPPPLPAGAVPEPPTTPSTYLRSLESTRPHNYSSGPYAGTGSIPDPQWRYTRPFDADDPPPGFTGDVSGA